MNKPGECLRRAVECIRAEEPIHLRRPVDRPGVHIPRPNPHIRASESEFETLFAVAQRLLSPFSPADVGNDANKPDDVAVRRPFGHIHHIHPAPPQLLKRQLNVKFDPLPLERCRYVRLN
jgi:hypothetical protein